MNEFSCTLAFFLTAWALFLDTATFASQDYSTILASASLASAGALAGILVSWPKLTVMWRVPGAICVVANAWVLVDAANRLTA